MIDFHPTTIGPAEVTADHLQQWFEAGAADGFWLSPDVYEDGVDATRVPLVTLLPVITKKIKHTINTHTKYYNLLYQKKLLQTISNQIYTNNSIFR